MRMKTEDTIGGTLDFEYKQHRTGKEPCNHDYVGYNAVSYPSSSYYAIVIVSFFMDKIQSCQFPANGFAGNDEVNKVSRPIIHKRIF